MAYAYPTHVSTPDARHRYHAQEAAAHRQSNRETTHKGTGDYHEHMALAHDVLSSGHYQAAANHAKNAMTVAKRMKDSPHKLQSATELHEHAKALHGGKVHMGMGGIEMHDAHHGVSKPAHTVTQHHAPAATHEAAQHALQHGAKGGEFYIGPGGQHVYPGHSKR